MPDNPIVAHTVSCCVFVKGKENASAAANEFVRRLLDGRRLLHCKPIRQDLTSGDTIYCGADVQEIVEFVPTAVVKKK